MTVPAVLILLVASFLCLLRYRFRDDFLRAYGLFFLILWVYASNKEYYGISLDLSEGAFSPLSLIRWGLLSLFVWAALRLKTPAAFHVDAGLGALVLLLLWDMLVSSLYADSFSYSFMRGLTFALLAFALMRGLTAHFFGSANCVNLFRL